MSRAIEIIDPEGERRLSRQRKAFLLAVMISLGLFGYPEAKDFYTKWQTLKAGRKLAFYLSTLKTNSILNKSAMEAKFRLPDTIEVNEVSSCGPFAERKRVAEVKLSDFEAGVEFAAEPWIRETTPSREPVLTRFCYDPLYGSAVYADGLVHGAIFLVHKTDIAAHRGDHLVQLSVEGVAGDLTLE